MAQSGKAAEREPRPDVERVRLGEGADSTPHRRVRLAPEAREQMILDAAIEFFAEHGFSAQTRQLAARIGVSQSLIFRYFGTKEALVDRVYHETFLSRWDPSWEDMLRDSSKPLSDRLKAFYRSYIAVVDDRRWIRIAMYSSLAGRDLTRRYIQDYAAGLLKIIAIELREGQGEPSDFEVELVWHLHSTVIYYLIRKHIHQTSVSPDPGALVDGMIDNFLQGWPHAWCSCLAGGSERASPGENMQSGSPGRLQREQHVGGEGRTPDASAPLPAERRTPID